MWWNVLTIREDFYYYGTTPRIRTIDVLGKTLQFLELQHQAGIVMLEITHGRTSNRMAATQLINALQEMDLCGSLYIGYPVLATADEAVTVDALLVTPNHGLVAFLFDDDTVLGGMDDDTWQLLEDRQDKLFVALENNLRQHDILRRGRRLGVEVQAITLVSAGTIVPDWVEGVYSTVENLSTVVGDLPPLHENYFKPLEAALQRVSTIKPPKSRVGVGSSQSKGAIIKKIEKEIANLDQWQRRAAIESPEGPQRIRGLAGSGKTIVLALKAAYLHTQNPDWNIAVTFWTRSLYQQFEDLIRRFSYFHSNDEPNWEKLRIIHAWGSGDREGIYRQAALRHGLTPRNFMYARSKYGMDRAFEGLCLELLSGLADSEPETLYDAVLIDEAQDLPLPFFRLIHRLTGPTKRIIWAYDELQNLSESNVPNLNQLFGVDAEGRSNVILTNPPNAPHQDIVLPICYRTTPWALALAHGLGLGTAKEDGLVQSFEEPSLWSDIGYEIVDGRLQKGSPVTLRRRPDTFPSYFGDLLTPSDSVKTMTFGDPEEQARWVAQSIRDNLGEDELEHDDILIVLPDAYTARSQAAIVIEALADVGIKGHLAGVTTSRDEIFRPDSIAIANIYRSKGNESPMVYILDAHRCVTTSTRQASLRSILFTAITRSKAWVRICGYGPRMETLLGEIDSIRNNDFRLSFVVPTDEQQKMMRQIHRELTPTEKAELDETWNTLENLFLRLDQGRITLDDVPMALRTALARHFGGPSGDSE